MTREDRFVPEKFEKTKIRSQAQIDRDRVLYSPHLARLAEVTQVRAVDGGYLVHNRLTHSLKVAQIARRMAERLKARYPDVSAKLQVNEDVAEAAGLAHDMGHPPFGHIAEDELNKLVESKQVEDGYEGNAQTFRILAVLTIGDTVPENPETAFLPGLNLSRASLNAVLKYPWLRGGNPKNQRKWGAYETERAVFEWAREGTPSTIRSVEAEIMDWADDITYAIHDMIDFHCAGLIPLHLLANGESGGELAKKEIARFFENVWRRRPDLQESETVYREALREALEFASVASAYDGTQSQSRDLWAYSSLLIGHYLDAIKIVDPDSNDGRAVQIEPSAKAQTTILKELTWKYVIWHHDLATIQYGQRKMIRELFQIFYKAIKAENFQMLPVGFSELVEAHPEIAAARWTADYISGLTEQGVHRLHRRLVGN